MVHVTHGEVTKSVLPAEVRVQREFALRVSELRKIDFQLNGNCYTYYGNNYSQGKINATAGGKQGLESVMIKVLLKYYLESTK